MYKTDKQTHTRAQHTHTQTACDRKVQTLALYAVAFHIIHSRLAAYTHTHTHTHTA